jgi:hypothetical protein
VLAAIEPLVVGRGEDGEPNGGDDGAERTGGSGLIGSFGAAVDMSEAMDAGIAVRHPRCAVAAPSGVCGGGGVAVAVAVGAAPAQFPAVPPDARGRFLAGMI